MEITVCNSWTELEAYSPHLDDLSRQAAEPNVFYQQFLLAPALKHLAQSPVAIVLTWTGGPSSTLTGLFPLEQRRSYHHLPLSHFTLWEHRHCFLSAPLLRSGYEEESLRALSEWAARQRPRPAFVNFTNCPAAGPFSSATQRLAQIRRLRLSLGTTAERALLQWNGTCEAYFKRYSKKFWKNTDRKRRKLESLGAVNHEILEDRNQLRVWIEEFLRIEGSGWKGRTGTALSINSADRLFITEALEQSFESGALEFGRLLLGERTIAMRVSFKSGHARFLFKIAYDEEFGQCSPGLLLELEEMRRRLTGSEEIYVDSCADPNNEFINALFLERRAIQTFRLGLSHPASTITVSLVNVAEKFRRRWHQNGSSTTAVGVNS